MKKKVLFSIMGIALFGFAIAFNINQEKEPALVEKNIEALKTAHAQMANVCCPIWNVTVEIKWTGPQITCTTGGQYKCKDCPCPESDETV